MGFVSHRTINLLKFIKVLAQIPRHKKCSELTVHNVNAQPHQKHNQDDGDNSNKHISNNQPPPEPPEQAAPDKCPEPPQIVDAGGYGRQPEQDPKRRRSAARELVHTPQSRPVSQHPDGETRHAARTIFPQKNFEQGSKHKNTPEMAL